MEDKKGLYGKYRIEKTDGSALDPRAVYFTLRLDTDPHARAAVRAYIESCREAEPELAADLERVLYSLTQRRKGAKEKEMKAITLTQPWATLVAIGAKNIETRSWKTNYRGKLAIHAAKSFPRMTAKELCFQEPFASALIEGGIPKQNVFGRDYPIVNELPVGCIVAYCKLVDCIEIPDRATIYKFSVYRDRHKNYLIPPLGRERDFGDYMPGRYAWVLEFIERLPVPIPAKGALGLWNWEPEQDNFFDAVENDPTMKQEDKDYWLAMDPRRKNG